MKPVNWLCRGVFIVSLFHKIYYQIFFIFNSIFVALHKGTFYFVNPTYVL